MDAVLWLILVIVLGVIEISTMSLVSIWFLIGGIGAMIAYALGASVGLQWVVFIVISLLLLIFTRPFVKNVLKVKNTRTNADRILGETAIVIQEIDNLNALGQVKVLGQIWTARSIDDDIRIYQGESVIVNSIAGVKLIVQKSEELTNK